MACWRSISIATLLNRSQTRSRSMYTEAEAEAGQLGGICAEPRLKNWYGMLIAPIEAQLSAAIAKATKSPGGVGGQATNVTRVLIVPDRTLLAVPSGFANSTAQTYAILLKIELYSIKKHSKRSQVEKSPTFKNS